MKPECNNCGFVRKALLVVVIIAVGALAFYKLEFSKVTGEANATEVLPSAENLLLKNETALKPTTITIKTKDIEKAPIIEYMFVKPNIVGADRVAVLITPKSDWQGDYTPASIAATLINAFNKWLSKDIKIDAPRVVIILYPTPKANESMLNEVALGRLEHNMADPITSKLENNVPITITGREIFVVKRGYLPQEVKYISQRANLMPSYSKNGTIDKKALDSATANKLGPEGYGMEYPFQPLFKVIEEK